jgi:hypothetical protein
VNQKDKAFCAGTLQSPLTDSNRRPPLYEEGPDGSLPDELVSGLLEDSYELVVDGLPKHERDLVRSRAS